MTFSKFAAIAAAHRPDAVVHAHGAFGGVPDVAVYFIRPDGRHSKVYIIHHISILKWPITVPYHVLMTKMKVSSKKTHNAIITYICASSLPPYR